MVADECRRRLNPDAPTGYAQAMPWKPPSHRPVPRAARPAERRPTAARRGYGHRWQVRSRAFLRANPVCVDCEREGRPSLATVVDHIIPHKGDWMLFWDEQGNWQALCAAHHGAKTRRGL